MGTPIYSREALEAAIVAADQSGDDEAVQALIEELKSRSYRSNESIVKRAGNPTAAVEGFKAGLTDMPLGVIQALANLDPLSGIKDQLYQGMEETVGLPLTAGGLNQYMADRERDYASVRGGGPEDLDVPRLAGNILGGTALSFALPGLMTARSVAAPGSGLAGSARAFLANRLKDASAGGTYSAAMPVTNASSQGDFMGQKAQQVGTGGVGGTVAGLLAAPFTRAVAPNVPDDIQQLRQMGVTPTPGQRLGGVFRRAEEGARSIPGLGDAIASSERTTIREFNRGMANRVLGHVNKSLPKNVRPGHEMIDHVGDELSKSYDALLPNLKGQIDKPFRHQLDILTQMADSSFPKNQQEQFHRILKTKLYDKFTPQGMASGTTLKEVESGLGRLATGYHRSPDFDQAQLGDALREVQNALRQMIGRVNPDYQGQLQPINKAWSEFLRLENAAARSGPNGGVFTPGQLMTSSKTMDASKHKRKFARGKAIMQPEADLGNRVLGSRLADSGTAYRSMMGLGLLGGGYTLGGPGLLASQLAMSAPYLPGGRQLIDIAMSGGMGIRKPLGELMYRASPLLGMSPLSAIAEEEANRRLEEYNPEWDE